MPRSALAAAIRLTSIEFAVRPAFIPLAAVNVRPTPTGVEANFFHRLSERADTGLGARGATDDDGQKN